MENWLKVVSIDRSASNKEHSCKMSSRSVKALGRSREVDTQTKCRTLDLQLRPHFDRSTIVIVYKCSQDFKS